MRPADGDGGGGQDGGAARGGAGAPAALSAGPLLRVLLPVYDGPQIRGVLHQYLLREGFQATASVFVREAAQLGLEGGLDCGDMPAVSRDLLQAQPKRRP
jgi:hypothetical protein